MARIPKQLMLGNGCLVVCLICSIASILKGQACERRDSELLRLVGHNGPVLCVAVSSDDRLIASASVDGMLRVWSSKTGRQVFSFKHADSVWAVCFTPKRSHLLSAGDDKLIRFWDLSRKRLLFRLRGHRDRILALGCSSDGQWAVSGSADKTAKVWDLKTGKERTTLEFKSQVISISIHPNNDIVAFGLENGKIELWNLASQERVHNLLGHKSCVWTVSFSRSGKSLLSGSHDRTIRKWDVESGKEVKRINNHARSVRAVAFLGDENMIVSASWDKTVQVANINSGKRIATFWHKMPVRSLAVFARLDRITTGSGGSDVKTIGTIEEDYTVRVWKLPKSKE